MSSSLRFAFVGCGGIARHHLRALRACGQATELVAVVDTRENNARELVKLIPREMTPNCGHSQVGGADEEATYCFGPEKEEYKFNAVSRLSLSLCSIKMSKCCGGAQCGISVLIPLLLDNHSTS